MKAFTAMSGYETSMEGDAERKGALSWRQTHALKRKFRTELGIAQNWPMRCIPEIVCAGRRSHMRGRRAGYARPRRCRKCRSAVG